MNLRGGLLIIGSLLWDDNLKENDQKRKKWRERDLSMENKILTKAPIRYGRKSRSGTFTMVFSKDLEKTNELGNAYVIPFKKGNLNFNDIEKYARSFSSAEGGSNSKLVKGNKNKWCTIGILINPNLAKDKKKQLISFWFSLLKVDGGGIDYQDYKLPNEKKSVLSSEGEILLDWPKTTDKNDQPTIDKIDFILAACTKPNISPSINDLVEGIRHDPREYFKKNRQHQISTFEDSKIIRALNEPTASYKKIIPMNSL